MLNSIDQNFFSLIVDDVENTIIAASDSIPFLDGELLNADGPRFALELGETTRYSLDFVIRKPVKIALCGWFNDYFVSHAS